MPWPHALLLSRGRVGLVPLSLRDIQGPGLPPWAVGDLLVAGCVAKGCGRAEPVALAAEKKGMAGLQLESLDQSAVLLNGRATGLGVVGFFQT